MWVRKTPEQIDEDKGKKRRRRKNPIVPIIIGLIGALIELYYEPNLSFFVFAFVLIFLLAYIGQLFFRDALMIVSAVFGSGGLLEDPMDICSTCFDVKKRDETTFCHCGGILEPLENWKWIEKG
jgi:hypothetical protein